MNDGTNMQIVLSPEIYMLQIQQMQEALLEKDQEIDRLRSEIEIYKKIMGEAINGTGESAVKKERRATRRSSSSEFKSDGKRKARAADSIRSYDDFKAIQDYFMSNGRIRDWAMWTIGVSLGFRVSDLLSLRFRNLIEPDKRTFKKRIQIYEIKTGKLNNCLITESVIDAMTKYLDSIKWEFDLDGFLFPSKKTKGKMYEECGWRILSDAGKALNLPIVIGSHTMRKSFANIAACVDKSSVDMNSITKVQGLLNHSDQRVTMSYLGSYQTMFDKARIAVSDFILGKTGINEIVAGNQYTIDDVFERLDNIEKMLI